MTVVTLQVFVSLMLVTGAVVLFIYSVRHKDHEHTDRLSLAPLETDVAPPKVEPLTPPLFPPP